MSSKHNLYHFLPDETNFFSQEALNNRLLYFPLCAVTSSGIKSSITPFLSGDIKIDKNQYLTKPCSREDLRNDLRNFFVYVEGKGVASFSCESKDKGDDVEAGQLWHKVRRIFSDLGIELDAINFVPVAQPDVEMMCVTVRNVSKEAVKITPTSSVPVFARALENKHDHEHVTALLNRIEQVPMGVWVQPTMLFNEEGHKSSSSNYFVYGISDAGEFPAGTFPTIESFLSDEGTLASPESVFKNLTPKVLSQEDLQGKEAMGALRFKEEELNLGESKQYFIAMEKANIKKKPKKFLKPLIQKKNLKTH